MSDETLTLKNARLEDAEIWTQMEYQALDWQVPNDISAEVDFYRSLPFEVTKTRFILWSGEQPIAQCRLAVRENVVELKYLYIRKHFMEEFGTHVLQQIITFARKNGTVLIAETYPETSSKLFIDAGFKQNTRIRMLRSLEDYQIQPVYLPSGASLRHPVPEDEEAVVELAFRNYQGTIDSDMVCNNRAQAAAMIRGMFGSEYSDFDAQSSFLAQDEQHTLIGDILLADNSTIENDELMWILDISVAHTWRGLGLGKALFTSGLNAARSKGYKQIGLYVTIGNDNAMALYRSFGFQEYGKLIYEGVLYLNR